MKKKETYTIRPIAYVRSDYNEKFGIPKQCGLVDELEQAVVLTPEFSNPDAVRGLEDFTHIWLIWGFSENVMDMQAETLKWSPTVRPPRLGGKVRKGVWASRSPYRPNSLGLSSVRLLRIETGDQISLIVTGADLMNGTPVFDIKPYLPYSDSHPEASSGYSSGARDPNLEVVFPDELLKLIEEPKREALIRILSLDPRDAYDKKDGYRYGMSFADRDVRFEINGNVLTVVDVVFRVSEDDRKCGR